MLQGNAKGCKTSQMRVLADQGPPSRIYPNAATGRNIFIYEDGKKSKEETTPRNGDVDKAGDEKEKGEDDGMLWEPPPLFEEEQEPLKGGEVSTGKVLQKTPVRPGPKASPSTSSASAPVYKEINRMNGMAEEDKKRMEVMEKDMEELKNKLSSLEGSMARSNEELNSKMTTLEQQQHSSNVDIKAMFAQLITEIGVIKSTVSTASASNAVVTEQEKERKKARVDPPTPTN